MWLLPLTSRLAYLAARGFYRLTVDGAPVPQSGPVLLVANHPNSLVDAVVVAAVARRPVRFLAKAPLFTDRKVGWLVRATGAIPVYRQADDPAQMARNADMFRAVHTALAEGAAIAVFPEGTSHSGPSLVPLRTGAARIALGAAAERGGSLPILPVGIVLRDKATFRSETHVVVGSAVEWDDLAAAGAGDTAAVQALTGRIGAALRSVTVNLAAWEDAPLVEAAESVWSAEREGAGSAAARVGRLGVAAELLERLRASSDRRWREIAHRLLRHRRSLERLGLEPGDLHRDLRTRTAVRWSLRRLHLALAPLALLALVGAALWWPPYRALDAIVRRGRLERDVVSTHKLLGGMALFAAWLVVLVVVATGFWGWVGGVATVLLAPAAGATSLWVWERWESAWRDARRFVMLRRHPRTLSRLRRRQREIAERLDDLLVSSHPTVP